MPSPSEGRTPRETKSEQARRLAERSFKWTRLGAIIGGVAIIVAIVIAVSTSSTSEPTGPASPTPSQSATPTPAASLLVTAAPAVVVNSPMATEVAGGRLQLARAALPQVQITLLNRGSERTIVYRATVLITDGGTLEACPQELKTYPLLDISAAYDIPLPAPPTARAQVSVPLSQQLAPDQADRFALTFGSRRLTSLELPDAYLYLLRISLTSYRGRWLDVGPVLIATPALPSLSRLSCTSRNRQLVARLARSRPIMSSELASMTIAVSARTDRAGAP